MRRTIAITLMIILSSACYRWTPGPALVAPSPGELEHSTIRLMRPDSSRVVMRHATVAGDSVYGRIYVDWRSMDHAEPISGIHAVEHRALNVPATVISVLGLTTLLALALAAATMDFQMGWTFQ